jgi:hypothetical protein
MNAALPPDICAFGDLIAIVFGEADPPLGCVGRRSGEFFCSPYAAAFDKNAIPMISLLRGLH